jgi:hypothetical protein
VTEIVATYAKLTWHERRAIRQQLGANTPLRRAAIAWLDEQYQKYHEAGGDLIALAWAQQILPVDLWNCLFAANTRMGSYGAPAVLLEKKGGQYRAVYKR